MSEQAEPVITYKFTTLPREKANETPELLAELPLKNVTFSLAINEAGPWQATLPIEDLGIRRAEWLEATRVNRTCMWVDIGGVLVYGGRVLERHYQEAAGIVTLGGSDTLSYLAQRWQAKDYSEYTDPEGHHWFETPGAPSTRIAHYMIAQALEQTYSLKATLVAAGSSPAKEHWITVSVPYEQHQPLASVLSQIQKLGYGVGCDITAIAAYVSTVPTFFIETAYPRAGENPLAGTPIIDLSDALDLEYSEDGTSQADNVAEQSGGGSNEYVEELYDLTTETYGYPLLQKLGIHPQLGQTELNLETLISYASADVALYAFPLTTPKVTIPMFGTPSILDFQPVGIDTELWVPQQAGQGGEPGQNPRFPKGLRYKFRAPRIDCTIPDQGLPTMAVTLNVPPTGSPLIPPEPF